MKKITLIALLTIIGCDNYKEQQIKPVTKRPGTGIIIVVDTSGSMAEKINSERKSDIARKSIEQITTFTNAWKTKHTDKILEVGLVAFDNSVNTVLDIQPFDQTTFQNAISNIPGNGGGTAIGNALDYSINRLHQTGLEDKYIVCITDGENTGGLNPEKIAQKYHQEIPELKLCFIAFDTDAKHFNFVKQVDGILTQASNHEELDKKLNEIYKEYILLEKED